MAINCASRAICIETKGRICAFAIDLILIAVALSTFMSLRKGLSNGDLAAYNLQKAEFALKCAKIILAIETLVIGLRLICFPCIG